MTTYRVRLSVLITPPDDLDDFTDELMGELLKICTDGDLGGSLTSGEFDIWVTVEAATLEDGVLRGTSDIRAAAHAAGARTHDWPTPEEWPSWLQTQAVEAHLVESRDCELVDA